MYQQLISNFVKQEALPQSYTEDSRQWFLPLVDEIEKRLKAASESPIIIGINGAQGTGKSTLAKLISLVLNAKRYSVANLSIDDFYFSKAKRLELANEQHSLLASRGVPGTHDVQQLLQILQQLQTATESDQITLPAFDKSIDDCALAESCTSTKGPFNVIILEGWFVGAQAQSEAELEEPVNQLEKVEDPRGQWRQYVNKRLGGEYQDIFSQIDLLIMMQAPAFEQVYEWRVLQEQKLRRLLETNDTTSIERASGLMSDDEIQRFIQHFERLTRHCLNTIPMLADIVFQLNVEHRVISRSGKKLESEISPRTD